MDRVNTELIPVALRRKVEAMLRRHSKLWDGSLGEIKITEHRIELQLGASPVRQHPYCGGRHERGFQTDEVARMARDGVIRPSQSDWASPVVLVPKPGGGLRFCVDYRKLNERTKKDSYPIPRMDDCIDTLGDASIFTTLDANSGYWQVRIAEEDKPKTAFTCHAGFWEFNRMPFGLTNAPATFQRVLDIVLAKYR